MPAIPNSILDTTKKILGLDADYDVFDLDVITHINSAFAQLAQLGVGPDDGFEITDSTTLWPAYLGTNKLLNSVKTYMYLKVRMWFDPPTTSFDLTAKEKQITELEWRLNVAAESGKANFENDGTLGLLVWEIDETQELPEEMVDGEVGFDPVTGNVWRLSDGS